MESNANWRTPSPESMSKIKDEAARIVDHLYAFPFEPSEMLVLDEVFPGLDFDPDDCHQEFVPVSQISPLKLNKDQIEETGPKLLVPKTTERTSDFLEGMQKIKTLELSNSVSAENRSEDCLKCKKISVAIKDINRNGNLCEKATFLAVNNIENELDCKCILVDYKSMLQENVLLSTEDIPENYLKCTYSSVSTEEPLYGNSLEKDIKTDYIKSCSSMQNSSICGFKSSTSYALNSNKTPYVVPDDDSCSKVFEFEMPCSLKVKDNLQSSAKAKTSMHDVLLINDNLVQNLDNSTINNTKVNSCLDDAESKPKSTLTNDSIKISDELNLNTSLNKFKEVPLCSPQVFIAQPEINTAPCQVKTSFRFGFETAAKSDIIKDYQTKIEYLKCKRLSKVNCNKSGLKNLKTSNSVKNIETKNILEALPTVANTKASNEINQQLLTSTEKETEDLPQSTVTKPEVKKSIQPRTFGFSKSLGLKIPAKSRNIFSQTEVDNIQQSFLSKVDCISKNSKLHNNKNSKSMMQLLPTNNNLANVSVLKQNESLYSNQSSQETLQNRNMQLKPQTYKKLLYKSSSQGDTPVSSKPVRRSSSFQVKSVTKFDSPKEKENKYSFLLTPSTASLQATFPAISSRFPRVKQGIVTPVRKEIPQKPAPFQTSNKYSACGKQSKDISFISQIRLSSSTGIKACSQKEKVPSSLKKPSVSSSNQQGKSGRIRASFGLPKKDDLVRKLFFDTKTPKKI